MSHENVEVVRRVYDAAARRDSATVFALYHPDVELDASRVGIPGVAGKAGVSRGHEGLRTFFQEWHEAWGEIEYSYEELIQAGEQVISIVSRHARGRASGIEVEGSFALLWTLRDGKVARVVWFLTRADALEAAGLSE
jgi:ketosteroid isomerase-like protein